MKSDRMAFILAAVDYCLYQRIQGDTFSLVSLNKDNMVLNLNTQYHPEGVLTMLTKIIIVCLAIGFIASYSKLKHMKKQMNLFQVASVYTIYAGTRNIDGLDTDAILAILTLLRLPVEKDTIATICIYLDLLDRNLSDLSTLEVMYRCMNNKR